MRLSFKNKATPETIKVKIVAKSNSSIKIIGDVTAPGNNPTMVLNGGELVFCLAPVLTQGVWVLNKEFNITEGIVTYTAYKNIRSTKYYSHASLSLEQAVAQSILTEGMMDKPAVITAIEQLIGSVDWVLDPINNQITYPKQDKPANQNPTIPWVWATGGIQQSDYIYYSAESAAIAMCTFYKETYDAIYWWPGQSSGSPLSNSSQAYVRCLTPDGYADNWDIRGTANPVYDPTAVPEEGFLPLSVVAKQIILNSQSETLSILKDSSEYLELVAYSIYTDIKYITNEQLLPQFEANIVRVSFEGVDQEHVKINKYTTSALDFEQGVLDRLSTTAWQMSGNYLIQNTNKIYSNYCLETKSLGDSLSTTSNVITGGSTPFTIEFYSLIKSLIETETSMYVNIVTSDNMDYVSNGQGLYIHRDNRTAVYYRYSPDLLDVQSKLKINFNEINKITISYDGACIRVFINDQITNIIGTLNGFIKRDFIAFYKSLGSTSTGQINGLLDNINIFDGVATKVRNEDPNEEFLIVDLSFDGQNNSTKIVDNGSLKSAWTANGNAKLSTDKQFDGFSSLYLDGSGDYLKQSLDFSFGSKDFTLSLSFILLDNSAKVKSILRNVSAPNNPHTFYLGVEDTNKLKFLMYDYDYTQVIINKESVSLIELNKEYKIDIVCQDNILSMYINNKIEFSQTMSKRTEIETPTPLYLGYSEGGDGDRYFKGYIKNFKIYKGVAIIPESPVGKIQLDFDNNVLDKYNNSTWTNSGVTFDQVNSVNGSSAKFTPSSYIETSSESLNFKTNNFNISFDLYEDSKNDGCEIFTNNTYNENIGSIWFASNKKGIGLDYSGKPPSTVSLWYGSLAKVFYNNNIFRNNGAIVSKVNDSLTGTHNISNTFTFNFINGGTFRIGKPNTLFGTFNGITGNIDNFKSYKEDFQTKIDNVIDRPAVHLPLETNSINTGFTNLTVNSVGNPIYTVIEGRKCIKFESGKYLTINSNNIFNFGISSDFYIEFDFYRNTGNAYTLLTYSGSSSYFELYMSSSNTVYINSTTGGNSLIGNINDIKTWSNIKIYRKNNITYFNINGDIYKTTSVIDFQSNAGTIDIGHAGGKYIFDGCMSNFKMFVGISEIPESYNDKKVLDLDFKPTRKSYLFKDNNNKCIIHPVNITQRDYQDSQYCVTLNGTNQYLELGKNNLFNFGLDDFILAFTVSVDITDMSDKDDILISNNIVWSPNYVGVGRYRQTNKLSFGAYGTPGYVSNNTFVQGINKIVVVRTGNQLTLILNDVETIHNNFTIGVNLNANESTRIGMAWDTSLTYFKGQIHSVKVLRNTTDLSLLEDPVWVDPFPPEPEEPPFEEGVLNFTELLKDKDPHNIVLDFKQLRYK